MPENPEPRHCHVRVTRIHANGGHNSRDVDILDRESWKRLVRGIKDTMIQGGEHHMRPLYNDDEPAVSAPAPLKLRVEALEAGIQYAIRTMGAGDGKEAVLECIDALEALLQRPAAKAAIPEDFHSDPGAFPNG